MGVLFVLVGGLMTFAALLSIIGIMVSDLREIRMHTKHHKRRYRRPFVSIIIRNDVCDECIASIRHSKYPKKEIVLAGERTKGSFILLPTQVHTFEPTTIDVAVRKLDQDPSRATIELLRPYRTPTTLPELLRLYHDIIVAPFIAVRDAFHITLPHTRWSLLINTSMPQRTWRTRLYYSFRWLAACANCVALVYICFVAAILYQPAYLSLYLVGFGIWLILAICHYANFSIQQKLFYLMLSPVSFGYFALLALYAPFDPLVRRIRAATGDLVWHSSHQSWV